MGRDVPFNPDAICDECGKKGAYDFMGDYSCQECSEKWIATEDDGQPTEVQEWHDFDPDC